MATYRWYKKLWNTITGKGERNRQAAEYDRLSAVVNLDQRTLTPEEEDRMRTYRAQNPDLAPSQRRQDIINAARQGDYSQYAQLKPMDKYMLHADQRNEWQEKIRQAKEAVGPAQANDPKAVAAQLVTGAGGVDLSFALNPVYRKGLAMESKGEPTPEKAFLAELDHALTYQVTLASFSTNPDAVRREYTPDASGQSPLAKKEAQEARDSTRLARAVGQWQHHPTDAETAINRHESQCKSMLKMHLLAQLGDFSMPTKGGAPADYTSAMSDMLGYGGRVGFVFPDAPAGQEDFAFQSIFTPDGKTTDDIGMFSRAATHGIRRPSREDAPSLQGYEELKGFTLNVTNHFNGVRNYGMDMAIGGLGATGLRSPDGERAIMNDGRCGHLYVGSCAQTKDGRQAMLVGLESDAPYRSNQTGHMHVMTAVAEENGGGGGMRTGMVGEKYGGRVVDLSAANPAHIQAVCAAVDNMTMEQMHQVAGQVLDKPMSDAQMQQLLTSDAFDYGPNVTPAQSQQMANDLLSAKHVTKDARVSGRSIQAERTAQQEARQQEARQQGAPQRQGQAIDLQTLAREANVATQRTPRVPQGNANTPTQPNIQPRQRH